MPEPERPETPADEGSEIPDEDAYDDAQSAREAKEDAQRRDAIPYERLKREGEPDPGE